MRIITHKQIMNLNLEQSQIYSWIVESFKSKKEWLLPDKISMKQPKHIFYNIMPSLNEELNRGGVKIVTRMPGRTPSLDGQIYLYSMSDAKPIAILDANYITAMRTGAVTALAINLYAKDNLETIAIMGLGVTASAIMDMLIYTLRGRKIEFKIYNYKNQAYRFIEKYKAYENFSFKICESYEKLIKKSDVIISSVTYTEENFANFKWFEEGVLVVPVHIMGFENCDHMFDKIFVDDTAHLEHMKNYSRFKYIEEMAEVIKNPKKGRSNPIERIISYNIGLSIHDITFASKIYDITKAEEHDSVNLESPSEKYWL